MGSPVFLVRGEIEECSCPLLPQAQRLVKETRKRVARGEGKVFMQGKLASNFLPGLPLSCTDQQAHPAALGTVGEEILARTQQILSVVCERGVWCPLVAEKYNESERLKSTEMPGKERTPPPPSMTPAPRTPPSPAPQPSELENGPQQFPRPQMEEHRAYSEVLWEMGDNLEQGVGVSRPSCPSLSKAPGREEPR